jgi:hypothetical protein
VSVNSGFFMPRSFPHTRRFDYTVNIQTGPLPKLSADWIGVIEPCCSEALRVPAISHTDFLGMPAHEERLRSSETERA